MYSLLVGKHPFDSEDIKESYQLIKLNACSFPVM